jgi:hypothetical protein
MTSSWLAAKGVNYRLQHHYASVARLLTKIGIGAYVVEAQGCEANVEGALYALSSQLNFDVHIGALTALGSIHHARHFVALGRNKLQVFMSGAMYIPIWFTKNFGNDCEIIKTRFLPTHAGLQDMTFNGFQLKASTMERALLESIFLCDGDVGLAEVAQIMETMTSLRPTVLQALLENCSSIRVKRIFLHLADKYKHAWFDFLDLTKVKLGTGKRVISESGTLDKKYLIVIRDFSEI